MQEWFSNNIGTILAGVIVLVIVAAIIIGMIRRKKSGKPVIDCGGECSKCGGGCSHSSGTSGANDIPVSATEKGMFRTVIGIDGMMCSMCESHMNDCIRNNFDVKRVISSFKKGETVVLSKEPLDEEKTKEEIGKIGYKVISFASSRI